MVDKLKKRYFAGSHHFFQGVRGGLAKPLALALLGLFLFTHAVAVCAELRADQPNRQSSNAAEYSFDGQSELQAEATNWRELRSSREGAENRLTSKLEVRSLHREFPLDFSRGSICLQFFSSIPLLYSSSQCEAPFSPRPPPAASSLQG